MNASERIREALLRSEAARKSGHSTATEPDALEETSPFASVDEGPLSTPAAEVESTLPLLGSNDREKVERAPFLPASKEAQKKSSALYIVAGVVVLAAAGAGAFFLIPHGSTPAKSESATQSRAAAQPEPQTASTTTPVTPPPAAEHVSVASPQVQSAPKAEPRVEAATPARVIETPARVEARQFTPPPVKQAHAQSSPDIMLDPSSSAIPGGSVVQTAGGLTPQLVNHAPAPPPAPTPAPVPLRVGGKVSPPSLAKRVPAVYPVIAKSAHVEGIVRFTAVIGKDGHVRDLKFVSGPRLLVQSAMDAIKQWVYRPSLLNGEPVEVTTQIDLQFTLNP